MKATLLAPVHPTTFRFRIAASSMLRASPDVIAQRRRQPVVVGREAMSASFLKHAEDQTILAMWAVLEALADAGWSERSFADWGVVAAANYFGRASIAQDIARFQQEGPWGISPHSIPHQSLHAISGTISQALKIHGPNFGIGGGANAGPDAFLLATALCADGSLPGLWLVLTGHANEVIPVPAGGTTGIPDCLAVALALTADDAAAGLRLSIGQHDDDSPHLPEFQLSVLIEEWQRTAAPPIARWRISDRHWIELEVAGFDAEERA